MRHSYRIYHSVSYMAYWHTYAVMGTLDVRYAGKVDSRTLEDILMSEDGHVRIRPTIAPVKYYPGGGAADYERLYDIVLLFVDLKNKRYPVHLKHLLFLLRNATEKLRIKPQFVMFIVNHPSLLNYAEKHKLYYLVEQLLKNLSPADEGKVSAWLQTNDSGYHIWSGYAKASEFLRVYTFGTHGKKKKNKQSRYQAGGLLLCFQFGRNYLAHPPTDDLALAEESLSYTFHVLLTTVIECLVRKLKPQLPDANGVLIDNPSATRLTEILSNPKADPASMRCFWDEEKVLIDE
ncbi:unnamed protein product [Urochloa decumbens]|uniref:Uncharacterized protein n=1 Tax=Urochloa decumbens TaxID=240449 RepID=A0ABC9BFL1_9POAL